MTLRKISNHPLAWIIGVHWALCLALLAGSWPDSIVSHATDSAQYDGLAVNLVDYKTFGVRDKPSAFRTPLYPMMLAGIY